MKSAWLALAGPAIIEDASDLANAELLFAALDQLELEVGSSPEASAIDAAVEGVMASPVGSENAQVQVMTIHRAKGLEFDHVVIPDLQRGVRGRERPLLYWTPVATGPGSRGIVLASRAESGEFEGAADPLEQWMRRLAAEREALELGRVAYVAATRAKRQLHLIGSARIRWTGRPAAAAHAGRGQPAALLLAGAARRSSSGRSPPAPERRATRCARRAGGHGWRHRRSCACRWISSPPEPVAPRRAPALRIAGEPEGSIRPEFDWAGAIAQAVGQVVHLELHRLVHAGQPQRCAEGPASRRGGALLREQGIDDAHLPAALTRVERALDGVSRSPVAGRLLDPAAAEGQSELALSAVIDGVVQSLQDRPHLRRCRGYALDRRLEDERARGR